MSLGHSFHMFQVVKMVQDRVAVDWLDCKECVCYSSSSSMEWRQLSAVSFSSAAK